MMHIHKADEASPEDKRGKYFVRFIDDDGAGPQIECSPQLQAALANEEKKAMKARDDAEETAAQSKLDALKAKRKAEGL